MTDDRMMQQRAVATDVRAAIKRLERGTGRPLDHRETAGMLRSLPAS